MAEDFVGEDAVKANVIKVVEETRKKLEKLVPSHGPVITTGGQTNQ